jgi:hypothetical protein
LIAGQERALPEGKETWKMSQEKVDRYKQEKANRKKIMRKQRVMSIVRKGVLTLAALALVAWLGYSAYDMYESGKERVVAEVNYDAVTNYLNGLSAEETTE